MNLSARILIRWFLLAMLIMFHGCQTLPDRPPRTRDGKICGVTRGLFQYRWWHYYERGMSFADCGFWTEAELDFREALRQREEDQRRARTYGMHFINYFPHGELGVVLYKQAMETGSMDRLRESIGELETSVAAVKSAKAEYYLDLARKALILKQSREKRPPRIAIFGPEPSLITNALSVAVRGTASDSRSFVRSVAVGAKQVRIDVSAPEIPFEVDVPLHPGTNEVAVTASNLAGETARKTVTIQVDRVGPVVGRDGYIFDSSGIRELLVEGKTHAVSGREMDLRRRFPDLPHDREIPVTAVDRAGNRTSAILSPVDSGRRSAAGWTAALWSDTAPDPSRIAATKIRPPFVKINLANRVIERHTYQDHAVIDGEITTNEEGVQLIIRDNQGRELLNLTPPRESYHFSCLAELDDGQNLFDIRAESPSRRTDQLTLKIERRTPAVMDPRQRLKLGVNWFFRDDIVETDNPLSRGYENSLIKYIKGHDPQRFAKVRNLRVGKDDFIDPDYVLTVADEKGYHCVLFGNVIERAIPGGSYSITINAWVEDPENNVLVAEEETEVYGEDVRPETVDHALDTLAEYMKIKIIDELPIVKGKIIDKDGLKIDMDIGEEKKLKRGSELIVYEESRPDEDTDLMGSAKVTRVEPEVSSAELREDAERDKIRPAQFVITR